MSAVSPHLAVVQTAAVGAKQPKKKDQTALPSHNGPCHQCNTPLSSSATPHIAITTAGVSQHYHAACIPLDVLLAVSPSAEYSAVVQHWPSLSRCSLS